MKKVKKEKIKREKFSLRARKNISESKKAIVEFCGNTKKSILLFGFLSLLVVIVSMGLSAYQSSEKFSLLYLLNIFPRLVTLFIFIAPSFLFRNRRTLFTIGAGLWLVFQMQSSDCRISWTLLVFTITVLLSGICWTLDTNKPWYSKGRTFMMSAVKWFYAGVVLTLILEIVHRMNPLEALSAFLTSPDIFGINIIVVLAVASFIFLIPKKKLAFFVYSTVWIILSYSSYLKCVKVSEPVYILDIFELKDAVQAMFTFLNFFDILFVLILIVLLVLGIRLFVKKEKSSHFKFAHLAAFLLVLITVPFIIAGLSNLPYAVLQKSGENKKDASHRNGFAYSFICSAVKSGVTMPADYSSNEVDKILKDIDANYQSRETGEKPFNIVAIQLESFVDTAVFSDITFEYDPLPFIHSLGENYSTGTVDVPVFGGQTVKSEFEFLTGLSMDNLPSGYNPFVQHVLHHPVDSIANYMKDNDYAVTCIHDYQGEFFNRDQVYYHLNFDRFLPRECISDIEERGEKVIFGNDIVFTRHMQEVMDASEGGDFIFDITCQLHGSYEAIPEDQYPMQISAAPDENGEIDKEFEGQVAYYTKEMLKFDEAIKSIIEYLESRGEPTYVIMYADHLPTLCNGVVDDEHRFKTQYFTWNNMGIPKDEDHEMELYMLSTYLCQQTGIDGTAVNKFHSLYEDIPENNKNFSYLEYYKLYEEEDVLYPQEEKEESRSDSLTYYIFGGILLIILTIFCVIMIGKKRFALVISVVLFVVIVAAAVLIFFPPKDTGTSENDNKAFKNENYIISQITPISVEKVSISDEILVVTGDGITKNTAIAINGKNYKLTYVDDNTGMIMGFDAAIQEGDKITLRIVGGRDGGTFTETEPYAFESIAFGTEPIPENVLAKIAELEELARITPSPEISPSPSPSPIPKFIPKEIEEG